MLVKNLYPMTVIYCYQSVKEWDMLLHLSFLSFSFSLCSCFHVGSSILHLVQDKPIFIGFYFLFWANAELVSLINRELLLWSCSSFLLLLQWRKRG